MPISSGYFTRTTICREKGFLLIEISFSHHQLSCTFANHVGVIFFQVVNVPG